MAVTSGVGQHFAWLNVGGSQFLIEHGSTSQPAKRETGSFRGVIPLGLSGAEALLANIGNDQQASITVQTRGVTATLMTGTLQEASFDYIKGKINFFGQDLSKAFHENKTSEKFINRMATDITQTLVTRCGIGCNISVAASIMAGKQVGQDYVKLTDSVSYAYVIQKMAEIDSARWFIDANGMFHYVAIGSPTGTYSITVNRNVQPIQSDCLELHVRRNIAAAAPHQVELKSWNAPKKQVITGTASKGGTGKLQKYVYRVPGLTQQQAQKHAQSFSNERASHELTVSATVVGDTTVSAGMGLQLSGTNYFDQQFDIDEVHNDFGMSGHRTHIVAKSAKAGDESSEG
jgi:hypothetical protein